MRSPKEIHRRVQKYIDDVLSGGISAGRWLKKACERYVLDCKAGAKRGLLFDEKRAAFAVNFFAEVLVHTKGSQWTGKPFNLSPSQTFIVWNLFGWLNANGTRRFRKAYITVARKWGKSTFAAGLAILLLYFDEPVEAGGEGYVAATKEDQAKIVHNAALRMVQACPELKAISTFFKGGAGGWKSLVVDGQPYNGSVFKPIGSDSDKTDGLNPSFTIKDELHEWKEYHRGLKEKLETGGGARLQPLDITITTAGDDHSQLWIEEDEYACKVVAAAARGQEINDAYFAFIARLDEKQRCTCGGTDTDCSACGGTGEIPGDDVFDENVWQKANPEIGVNPTWDFMRQQALEAKQKPSFKRTFTRYHLNTRVESKVKMFSEALWALGGGVPEQWKNESIICGGFDLGWRDDLASVAAVSRKTGPDGRDIFEVRQRSFICEDSGRDLTVEPWPTWIRAGLIDVTPGNTTDLQRIENTIVEWAETFGCWEWRFDPANARQMGTNLLNNHGIDAAAFPQTYSQFNEPMREFLRVLSDGSIRHGNDPILAWAASNVVAKEGNRGEWMPDKLKSADKIDPMVAVYMAFSGVLAKQSRKGYYETNSLELL